MKEFSSKKLENSILLNNTMPLYWALTLLYLSWLATGQAPEPFLLAFGPENGDTINSKEKDGCSDEQFFDRNFRIGHNQYSSTYVCMNGYLSFGGKYEENNPARFDYNITPIGGDENVELCEDISTTSFLNGVSSTFVAPAQPSNTQAKEALLLTTNGQGSDAATSPGQQPTPSDTAPGETTSLNQDTAEKTTVKHPAETSLEQEREQRTTGKTTTPLSHRFHPSTLEGIKLEGTTPFWTQFASNTRERTLDEQTTLIDQGTQAKIATEETTVLPNSLDQSTEAQAATEEAATIIPTSRDAVDQSTQAQVASGETTPSPTRLDQSTQAADSNEKTTFLPTLLDQSTQATDSNEETTFLPFIRGQSTQINVENVETTLFSTRLGQTTQANEANEETTPRPTSQDQVDQSTEAQVASVETTFSPSGHDQSTQSKVSTEGITIWTTVPGSQPCIGDHCGSSTVPAIIGGGVGGNVPGENSGGTFPGENGGGVGGGGGTTVPGQIAETTIVTILSTHSTSSNAAAEETTISSTTLGQSTQFNVATQKTTHATHLDHSTQAPEETTLLPTLLAETTQADVENEERTTRGGTRLYQSTQVEQSSTEENTLLTTRLDQAQVASGETTPSPTRLDQSTQATDSNEETTFLHNNLDQSTQANVEISSSAPVQTTRISIENEITSAFTSIFDQKTHTLSAAVERSSPFPTEFFLSTQEGDGPSTPHRTNNFQNTEQRSTLAQTTLSDHEPQNPTTAGSVNAQATTSEQNAQRLTAYQPTLGSQNDTPSGPTTFEQNTDEQNFTTKSPSEQTALGNSTDNLATTPQPNVSAKDVYIFKLLPNFNLELRFRHKNFFLKVA